MFTVYIPDNYDEIVQTDLPTCQVFDCDPEPSGLLDANGRPLVRPRQRVGFAIPCATEADHDA